MTNTPDTSPEAVKPPIRFRPVVSADGLAAARMDRNGNYVMYADYAALSAALEAEKRHKLAITGDKINAVSELRQVKAERDALKAELAEAATHALDRLDASLFTNAEHQQAKDILRAFLARHQKETGV